MHFMVIRRADAGSELPAFPPPPLREAVPAARWLHPTSQATRLTMTGDGWSVQEGPFPVDEVVAGFAIIDAASKDDAVAWAKGWPTADGEGHVELEVRETGCSGGCAGVDTQSPPHLTPYAVLLRSNRNFEDDVMPPPEAIGRMMVRNAADAQAGVLLAGDGLQPSAKGARVRFDKGARGGRPMIVDGPFTEIKELIAGFWLIQARTREEAVAWIESYPFPFGTGTVLELREVCA